MELDTSRSQFQDGHTSNKNMLDDSDQYPTPSESRAHTITDPEKGQESPPREKEEQVRPITGFKVGQAHQSVDQGRPGTNSS